MLLVAEEQLDAPSVGFCAVYWTRTRSWCSAGSGTRIDSFFSCPFWVTRALQCEGMAMVEDVD
jgi:hypothetical protein